MADSIRQQIRDAIKTRLEGITIQNGYQTDVGLNVHRWKVTAFQDGTEYGLNFKDTANDRIDGGPIGFFRWGLNIEVEIVSVNGDISDDEALLMLNDLYTAIGTDETWGGLAQWTEQPSDNMEVEQADVRVGGVKASFQIVYDAPKWRM